MCCVFKELRALRNFSTKLTFFNEIAKKLLL